jgi:hypothetical protein
MNTSAKFQQCSVIFAKSAVKTKILPNVPSLRAFFADTVETGLEDRAVWEGTCSNAESERGPLSPVGFEKVACP